MFRGLTWDHPRGRNALERAAQQTADSSNPLIRWDVQPLEGFESAPIEELAARYDVIVLDHPHLGEAVARQCLQPLDAVFPASMIKDLAVGCVGPSLVSYRLDDRQWALPLDAATQVSVRVPELVPTAPTSWDQLGELDAPVAVCLAGPHALMNFFSACVGLGAIPHDQPGNGLVDLERGVEAYRLLAGIVARMAPELAELNPIGMLDRMRRRRDIGYLPWVYGYVNYAAPGPDGPPLHFSDVPQLRSGGRLGSTIGGTGLALSARCTPDQALVDHLGWLLSQQAQTGFIPDNDGQPSLRSAWTDGAVNAAAGDFYADTLATIDDAWVRPRFDGYIGFQTAASTMLRQALLSGADARRTVEELNQTYDRSADAGRAEGTQS